MKNTNWKDVAIRAIKTFIQTAVSYLIAALSGVDFFGGDVSETFWVGLALSAGASGASAAWNGVIEPIFRPHKPPEALDAPES